MKDWEGDEINKFVRKLLKSYAAKGVRLDIKKRVISLPNNRLRLNIKVLPETRVADIKRYVRLSLKLSVLEVMEGQTDISIVVSKDLPMDEYHLRNISKTPAFATAQKTMGLALSLGIDDSGNPVIVDLMDPRCPHIIVSGTSGSGKSVALKSMLAMMAVTYPPQKVNLLIGDKANDLSPFKDLPHLSYPLIEDFDTFLNVLLALKEEMDRRISMKNTEKFSQLPIIVCVVDEFNSLMAEAPDKWNTDLAVDTITQILRMGRNARIHFILAAHNPTKANMRINTSDLPVKMAFQVSNTHNSVTALGEGGAEKLRGQGDMLFKMNGKIQHLQGAFISQKEIDNALNWVRQIYNPKRRVDSPKQYRSKHRYFPRGSMGFTITDSDLQRMNDIDTKRNVKLEQDHVSSSAIFLSFSAEVIAAHIKIHTQADHLPSMKSIPHLEGKKSPDLVSKDFSRQQNGRNLWQRLNRPSALLSLYRFMKSALWFEQILGKWAFWASLKCQKPLRRNGLLSPVASLWGTK